jgi:hypothetical protein
MGARGFAADEMTPAEREDQRDKLILHVLCEELVPWTVEERWAGASSRRVRVPSPSRAAGR